MKKLTVGIILIVALFSFSTYAYSDDWVHWYFSGDELYYIDCESILIEGNKITFWESKKDENDNSELRVKLTIDCKNQKGRCLDSIEYNADGSVKSFKSCEDLNIWKAIPQDTIMDLKRKLLCNENNKPRINYKLYLKDWEEIVYEKRKIASKE